MRKRGTSKSGLKARLVLGSGALALICTSACGGTSSETPYPREPAPRQKVEETEETGTGGSSANVAPASPEAS